MTQWSENGFNWKLERSCQKLWSKIYTSEFQKILFHANFLQHKFVINYIYWIINGLFDGYRFMVNNVIPAIYMINYKFIHN